MGQDIFTTNASQPASILVIDDSIMHLKFLLLALQRAKYTVFSAENGEEGLALAIEHRPDLILLDIMMPGIDGFETCRRLKANPKTEAIPVIFMSALSDTTDKVKGLEVGAADYVTKPAEVPEILARVKTQLQIYHLQNSLREQNKLLEEENIKRKRVQDALRESRQRYRLLADNSTDIISRQRLDGTYLYVSPACYPLLGYKIEEMIGLAMSDFIHPDDDQVVARFQELSHECPATLTVTYRARHKAGHYIWLETISRTVCIDDTKIPDEIVSVSRDVTERIQMQQALRARNEELDAFAHTVAHDLKNPLGALVSYTGFLIDAWDRLDDERKRSMLGNVGSISQKGVNIIDELLLLASVRKEDVELEPVDMGDVVDQSLQRLQPMIEEYGGDVKQPDEWPAALGYAPWIEEVWTNYLSNGLKYGGQPPQIQLGSTTLGNGLVRFWVRDNGQGLTPKEQAALFTEFSRLEEARVEGHGLGLSIVRRIVEKLDGQVGVESQPGHGSEFYFLLPGVNNGHQK